MNLFVLTTTQIKEHHLQDPRKPLVFLCRQSHYYCDFKQNEIILPGFELDINSAMQYTVFMSGFFCPRNMLLLCSSPMFKYHSDHHWDCFQFGAIMSKAVIIFLEIFWYIYLYSAFGYTSKSRTVRFCYTNLKAGLVNWYIVDLMNL